MVGLRFTPRGRRLTPTGPVPAAKPDTASREMDWPGRRLSMRWSEPCLTHDGGGQAIQFDLLRAQAYIAEGNVAAAFEQCVHAQKQDPQNLRVRLRIAQFKQKTEGR